MDSPLLVAPAHTEANGPCHCTKSHLFNFWRNLFAESVPQDFLSPFLGPTLLLPFAVAFVGVTVAGNASLRGDFSKLLSMVILSQALSTLAFALSSQYRTCTNIDLLTAVFLGAVGKGIVSMVNRDELFMYILISQSFLAILLGTLLCVLAKVDGLWFLRFMPYPVSSGFVAGIGLMVMDGGFELGTGMSMQKLVLGLFGGLHWWHYVQMIFTCIAAAVFLSLKLIIDNALRLPLGILITACAVHGIAHLLHLSMQDLTSYGMMLEGLSPEPWSATWSLMAAGISSVDWTVFVSRQWIALFVPYTLLHVILWVFYVSGFEDVVDLGKGKKVSLNAEIRSTGGANILVGLFSGVPICHSYKLYFVMKSNGGRSRLWVVLLGITFTFLFFEPSARQQLAIIPKLTFGGLVLSMGVDFVRDAVIESRKRVAPAERRIVGLTGFVTYLNVLLGLGLGCFLMMVFFIIEYSGITGITNSGTLERVRSLVDRSPAENLTLSRHGREVVIFWCSGYIFFGTASSIIEEIDSHLQTNPETHVIIIDFEFVPAVDASGVHLLMKFADRCQAQVCFCGMVRRLALAFEAAAEERGVHGLKLDSRRIEQALYWAESELIMAHAHCDSSQALQSSICALSAHSSPKEMLKKFLEDFAPDCPEADYNAIVEDVAVEVRTHSKGTTIFEEGTCVEELTYIINGQVKLSKTVEPDEQVKLPRYHLNAAKGDLFVFEERASVTVARVTAGCLLGAMEFGASFHSLDAPNHITTATAQKDCQVLVVPFNLLQQAFQAKSCVGFAFMKRIGWEASIQVMRLVSNSHLKPYRIVNALEQSMTRQLSWSPSSYFNEGAAEQMITV